MTARASAEQREAPRPWLRRINLKRALKVRNINVNYSALSELHSYRAGLPGATRLTLFGACPWLSYSAPLALSESIHVAQNSDANYLSTRWKADMMSALSTGAGTLCYP